MTKWFIKKFQIMTMGIVAKKHQIYPSFPNVSVKNFTISTAKASPPRLIKLKIRNFFQVEFELFLCRNVQALFQVKLLIIAISVENAFDVGGGIFIKLINPT